MRFSPGSFLKSSRGGKKVAAFLETFAIEKVLNSIFQFAKVYKNKRPKIIIKNKKKNQPREKTLSPDPYVTVENWFFPLLLLPRIKCNEKLLSFD